MKEEETSVFCHFPQVKPSRTKIVATVGPASDSPDMLRSLVKAGVDVFRLNFAHDGPEGCQGRLDAIRQTSEELRQPIAVLADLAGPKMRLGVLPEKERFLHTGDVIRFVPGEKTDLPDALTTTYAPLIEDLRPGDRVLLADGTVALEVTRVDAEGAWCNVVQGGRIRSRQGVNLPGVRLSVATLQPNDRTNAIWATEVGLDFLGLSFVRTVEDIRELRALLAHTAEMKVGADVWSRLSEGERRTHYPGIIAKIEKPETLDCLAEIIEESDGVMVARGDLGVEVDIARIAVVQKEIIDVARRANKPVIVATQMLESMTEELLPTRAEATDVANAILDGADACMLSGETAVGKHPVEAVEMMNRIARETEKILRLRTPVNPQPYEQAAVTNMARKSVPEDVRVSLAVCDVAGQLADTIAASLIFVATKTGRTALNLSKMRNFVMTVGTSTNEAVLRRLCLYWGVIPIGGVPEEPRAMVETIVRLGKDAKFLKANDRVVLVTGIGAPNAVRNALYVHTIEQDS
ncbi:MAG: pyruvate kinase [Planctomycetia bacterium]|nr:pyruvate kinase [Planctomycetia bacterium]